MNKDLYTYRITWSEEDQEYVGLCLEFPSLSWLEDTPEGALVGIRQVVAEAIEDMKETSESIPDPLSTQVYSGRFMVQVSPLLHRNLVFQACEVGISFDRWVNHKLSQ